MRSNYISPKAEILNTLCNEFCENGSSIINESGYVQLEITEDTLGTEE